MFLIYLFVSGISKLLQMKHETTLSTSHCSGSNTSNEGHSCKEQRTEISNNTEQSKCNSSEPSNLFDGNLNIKIKRTLKDDNAQVRLILKKKKGLKRFLISNPFFHFLRNH